MSSHPPSVPSNAEPISATHIDVKSRAERFKTHKKAQSWVSFPDPTEKQQQRMDYLRQAQAAALRDKKLKEQEDEILNHLPNSGCNCSLQ